MTRSTRKRIFYLLVLFFFVISGAVVMYSEGWRLNFSTFQTERVGAIFVRSFPKNANISVGAKPIDNKSGFLSAGTLVSNLFPSHYSVTLKEPGYLDWTENVDVLPTLVTELKYAVLVPQNATSTATSTVKMFFVAAQTPVIEDGSSTVFWKLGTIGRGDILSHSTNLRNLIIKNKAGADILYDLTEETSTDLGTFSHIVIDPYDAGAAYAWNAQTISEIDLALHTPTRIATSSPAAPSLGASVAISPSYLAWSRTGQTATSSQITIYDKFAKAVVNTTTVPGTVAELKWISGNDLGIVTGQGGFYRYSVSGQAPQKIADDVKDFYPDQNGQTIAALEHQSIEILSSSQDNYYRFNLPDIGNVKSLIWYKDLTHLFVEYPDHISFLDFADSGLRNFLIVSNGTSPQYDAQTNALYLIDQGQKLVRFDFPN